MDRDQILALYDWADGICFRHPVRGVVPTAVVGFIHPRSDGRREVRACEQCVIEMESTRREEADRLDRPYKPGHLGETPG